uniref:Uncharacterized protein n=1 Tax=Amazona collaria TaxID=241587 RepID=A0A8B9FX55_9PSIT
MKLLTHNLLCSNVRGLRPGGGFPLRIQASDVCVRPVPFNAAFVARLVPRLLEGGVRSGLGGSYVGGG